MGLLNWIKNRQQTQVPREPDLDSRSYGHKTWSGVFAEIRADIELAKVRDQTGKEPEASKEKKIKRPRPSWER